MGVANGGTSGKKALDFVTERTKSGGAKRRFGELGNATVKLFRRRARTAQSARPAMVEMSHNIIIKKELDTV
jgi:hypothetical protein